MSEMLAEIPLGRADVLRVTRESARGHDIVNLRRWFRPASGEMRPGRDGIAIPLGDVEAVAAVLGSLRSGKP